MLLIIYVLRWESLGLLANLRKMFNKNIECGEEITGHFIYLYPSGNRIVHVNSHIIVGDNYNAVFVCNDRVCDVLPPGKHKLTGATLPVTFSKLKLDKPTKNGSLPKKFKADVYFVYKEVMEQQQFCSFERFVKKSTDFGKVKGYTEGLLDIQVTDPEKLFKVLLIDRYYIPNKLGLKIATGYIGNEINRMLEVSETGFTEMILKPAILKPMLNPAINERIENLGVRVYNVEVTSLKLNRKTQKKVAMFLHERKSVEDQFEQSGIKYTPEQIVPDKVDVTAANPISASAINAEQDVFNGAQQTSAMQPQSSQMQTPPQIIRRGGLQMQNNEQQTEYNAKLNTYEVFNSENKKVCKFCNQTIDAGYSFCPRCGFKQ